MSEENFHSFFMSTGGDYRYELAQAKDNKNIFKLTVVQQRSEYHEKKSVHIFLTTAQLCELGTLANKWAQLP